MCNQNHAPQKHAGRGRCVHILIAFYRPFVYVLSVSCLVYKHFKHKVFKTTESLIVEFTFKCFDFLVSHGNYKLLSCNTSNTNFASIRESDRG